MDTRPAGKKCHKNARIVGIKGSLIPGGGMGRTIAKGGRTKRIETINTKLQKRTSL